MLRPWCHPYCLSISVRDATHWRHPGLLRCCKGRKTTFCWLLYCEGTTHLFLLASVQVRYCMLAAGFLRSAAHEGVLRGLSHSELPLFIGSLSVPILILCSFNAGQCM